jgi:hypothetical protein
VAIGLTVLAFRHEGLREQDLRALVEKLKAQLDAGTGPIEKRPEWLLWKRWIGAAVGNSLAPADASAAVHPLDAFQLDDTAAFEELFKIWRRYSPVIDRESARTLILSCTTSPTSSCRLSSPPRISTGHALSGAKDFVFRAVPRFIAPLPLTSRLQWYTIGFAAA